MSHMRSVKWTELELFDMSCTSHAMDITSDTEDDDDNPCAGEKNLIMISPKAGNNTGQPADIQQRSRKQPTVQRAGSNNETERRIRWTNCRALSHGY